MRLVIIGAGFAGMYAALSSARLRDIEGVSPEELEIALVAPEPTLVVRPRLYEPKPETLTAPLLDVLKAIDVAYVQGSAETIDTKSRTVEVVDRQRRAKDALLRSAGRGHRQPTVPPEHSRPRRALRSASTTSTMRSPSTGICIACRIGRPRPARDTVVVAGGGFTGIEAATEMPSRLRAIFGKNAKPRVVIVERNKAIAPDMGAGPRPIIEDALRKLGVETRLGAGVASLDKIRRDADQRRAHRGRDRDLGGGHSRRAADRADPGRARQFRPAAGRPGPARSARPGRLRHRRCRHGRKRRCRQLRADVVPARDADGRLRRQQRRRRAARRADQALPPEGLRHLPRSRRGRRALHARLGPQGGDGRRRQAKKTKQEINTVWIYPPKPERAAALASADPERVTDL